MWFFTVVLIIVAGYFLYYALQDRLTMEHSNELGSAQRHQPTAADNTTHQYKNTRDAAGVEIQTELNGPDEVVTDGAAASSNGVVVAISDGARRTRESLRETWDSAKTNQQNDQAEKTQRDISQRAADSTQEIKDGTKRFVASTAEMFKGAKTRYQTDIASNSTAEPTSRIDALKAGIGRFKTETAQTLKEGASKVKTGDIKRPELSDFALNPELRDQTSRALEATKESIGSGAARLKEAVNDTKHKLHNKREPGNSDATSIPSGDKETPDSGSARLKQSASETASEEKQHLTSAESTKNGSAKDGASTTHTAANQADGNDAARQTESTELRGTELNTPKGTSAAAAPKSVKPAPVSTTSPVSISSETSTDSHTPASTPVPAANDGKSKFLEQPQGKKDDLTKVKGIGKAIQKSLNKMGVYHFQQLADFEQADIDFVNAELDFPGRIERDDWIEQAKTLAAGRSAGNKK